MTGMYIVHDGKRYEIDITGTGVQYETAGDRDPQVINHAELIVRVDLGDFIGTEGEEGEIISMIFDRAHEILEASVGL